LAPLLITLPRSPRDGAAEWGGERERERDGEREREKEVERVECKVYCT
jgi:hypothetical protein